MVSVFDDFKTYVFSYLEKDSNALKQRSHDNSCSQLFNDVQTCLASGNSVRKYFPDSSNLDQFNFMKCVQYDLLVNHSNHSLKTIKFNPSHVNLVYPMSYEISSENGELVLDFHC